MMKTKLCLLCLVVAVAVSMSLAQPGQEGKSNSASMTGQMTHVVVTPDQIKWGPAPLGLPAGSQVAVIEGDPSKPGVPFALRAKLPDGYKIAPHWHPTDEKITVLQGTFGMGFGEKFDPAMGSELPAGSYAVTPKGEKHFVWIKGETIIQVSGMGPFEINYVNPTDDPRNAPKK